MSPQLSPDHFSLQDGGDPDATADLPSVPMERNLLYLPGTSIRAIHCSQSLYEGDEEDPSLSSEEMVDSTNHLHRRYVLYCSFSEFGLVEAGM